MSAPAWTAFKDEQPPAGNSPIYVTDGSQVSFVQRAVQPFTEGERWIVAEPEAATLKFPPAVDAPTHWAVTVPGLPKVKAEDVPVVSSGGPPTEAELHPEREDDKAGAKKARG